jgi:hypothetical protein
VISQKMPFFIVSAAKTSNLSTTLTVPVLLVHTLVSCSGRCVLPVRQANTGRSSMRVNATDCKMRLLLDAGCRPSIHCVMFLHECIAALNKKVSGPVICPSVDCLVYICCCPFVLLFIKYFSSSVVALGQNFAILCLRGCVCGL